MLQPDRHRLADDNSQEQDVGVVATAAAAESAGLAQPGPRICTRHGSSRASLEQPELQPRALVHRRQATWLHATWHNVTAMVGAGALALPRAVAVCGWAGGAVLLLGALLMSWFTFVLLVFMHEVPVPVQAAGSTSTGKPAAAALEAGYSQCSGGRCSCRPCPSTAAAGASAQVQLEPPSPGGAATAEPAAAPVHAPVPSSTSCACTEVVRMSRYRDLTVFAFGPRAGFWAHVPFQLMLCFGVGVALLVGGAQSLRTLASLAGASDPARPLGVYVAALVGALALLSQIPSLERLWWVSFLGSAAALGFCALTTALSFVALARGHGDRTGGGTAAAAVPSASAQMEALPAGPKAAAGGPALADADIGADADVLGGSQAVKALRVFSAITTVVFAFGGHNIALETQATLPFPPSTVPRMLRSVHVAFVATGVAYLLLSFSGYAAFGPAVSDNVLHSLAAASPGVPSWAVQAAIALLVLNILASYQLMACIIHDMVEELLLVTWGLVCRWPHRLVLRSAYVALTGLLAVLLPFFGDLMGLVGAIGVAPTTFVLPCVLWLSLRRPGIGSVEGWAVGLTAACLAVVGALGLASSVFLIARNARSYTVFGSGSGGGSTG